MQTFIRTNKINILNIILFISLFSSCIPQKELEYLTSKKETSETYNLKTTKKNYIQPSDEILIKVSSFDDLSFNYFEAQNDGRSVMASNEMALSALAYTVDEDGYVYFPILGKLKLGGLTLGDAADFLKKQLGPYFDQPMVDIKYAYKKVTILGEVGAPGYHTYTKDQINIFEALGMAGDISIHGNKKKVLLIRNENDKTTKNYVDLTDNKIISSEFFQVKPYDVIIVNPRKSAKWGTISTPISLIFSSITTTILILNYIGK